jgi:2-oxo-3-hexenedioate decarboxylase
MSDLDQIAQRLDEAAHNASAIKQLAEELTIEQAYEIQKQSIDRRLSRGEKRIGMKMGFTSRAKMVQMGVSDMIWGRLTDAMIEEEGGTIQLSNYIHPRVEPEVVYLLGKPLSGRITPLLALDAVEAVAPALEIIDSRYDDFKFSLTDVVADNCSSSGLVIGNWQRPDTDVSNLGLILSVNGKPMEFGSTAAILGDPIRSLVAAARMVAEAGEELPAGSLVMAGGATAAIALSAGETIELELELLGRASFSVE